LQPDRQNRHNGAAMYVGSHDVSPQDPLFALSSLLLRAHFHCAVGGVRFGLKATRRFGRSQLLILDQITAAENRHISAEQILMTVLDEVRGCLRGVGEDASCEVARLSRQMQKLDAEAKELAARRNGATRVYQRRWKAKD
jgi:hypothetical protein